MTGLVLNLGSGCPEAPDGVAHRAFCTVYRAGSSLYWGDLRGNSSVDEAVRREPEVPEGESAADGMSGGTQTGPRMWAFHWFATAFGYYIWSMDFCGHLLIGDARWTAFKGAASFTSGLFGFALLLYGLDVLLRPFLAVVRFGEIEC